MKNVGVVAGGRMPQPAGFAGHTVEPERIFGYEKHFQQDLPHDVESIREKMQLKNFRI